MSRRVGVIGGGQLAWMMAGAAEKLEVELVVQTPHPSDPAVAIATYTVFAPIDDAEATARLSTYCEVITFENEFIDLKALALLEQQGVRFYPSLGAIAPLLDKYEQRSYLRNLGLPTPGFVALDNNSDVSALGQFGFPVVLKARRHGYDGQGTHILSDRSALESFLALRQRGADATATQSASPEPSWLLEEFVPFDRELAVMAARSQTGEIVLYPVVETQQESQVCRRVIVTNDLDASVVEQVKAIAHTLLNSLNFVGIMGIEFFLTPAGKVLVNETAPRTHNSGHYSLDASVTSQFEQHLRAVCGLPLGDPALRCAGAVMVNLLGYEVAEQDYWEKRQQLAQVHQAFVHWYGKSFSRPGRKLGHVTVLLKPGEGRQRALEIAKAIESIWYQ